MSNANDPLKNGAIFRLLKSPPLGPSSPLGDQGNEVKNVFENLYRATPLPAHIRFQSPTLPGHVNPVPPYVSPTSSNYWSVSGPAVPYTFDMSPPSLPSAGYSNSSARKSSEPLKVVSFNHISEPQEHLKSANGNRFDDSTVQKDSIPRSQSVPPARPASTALTAPVNSVNVPEGRSESTGRLVARGSRLASGGNTGLAALASSILTGPSMAPVRSVSTSNGSVNNSSARTKVDGTRTTAPIAPGRTTSSSVSTVVFTSALMGSAITASSSSSSGTTSGIVIHSPPVKRKTPQPIFASTTATATATAAVTSVAGRATPTPANSINLLRGGPSGNDPLQEHINHMNARRSPYVVNSGSSPRPPIAAPTAAKETSAATLTVTRSGRNVTATKRLVPEEFRTGNNSTASTPSVNNTKSQQSLVAVNVNESNHKKRIRPFLYQSINRMKGSIDWAKVAEEVNEKLKEGPRVTENDCREIYEEMKDKHNEMKRKASTVSSDRLAGETGSGSSISNNNNNNSRLDKSRDDEEQPEKRKRVTQKAMKSMAIAASQSERQDDLFDKLDNGYNTTHALVRGSGVESIKTPAAGNKSSQPGNRRLNNNQSNSNEEDDSDDDDESGYNRLVSNNRGRGGGEDSPEITFNRRVANKLILPKKNFAASMIESINQKKTTKRPANHTNRNHAAAAAAMRRRVTTVSDDDFKGSIDPRSGLVHIVPHLAADSASEGESDEENFSEEED